MPPPGMTLMLRPAFSRSSSAMPPEIVYQPPPTAPAVHVSDCCAAAPPASAATRARVITASPKRFSIGPASCFRYSEHVGFGAQPSRGEAVES